MGFLFFFFFQAEDGIRDLYVTGVQTCALPISSICPKLSFTSLNLSRSTSTTENGRPEREARFHSPDRASQKKRRVLMLVRPSVIDCCCSFWKTNELCSAVASKSASVFITS